MSRSSPAASSALLFGCAGDSIEILHGEIVEELTLIARLGRMGLVKNTISFMGEQVATLWAVITPQASSAVWQETKPDWPNP